LTLVGTGVSKRCGFLYFLGVIGELPMDTLITFFIAFSCGVGNFDTEPVAIWLEM